MGENGVCLVCESDEHLKRLESLAGGLIQCERCQIAFRWPQPNHHQLAAYYSEDYPKHFGEFQEEHRIGIFSHFLKKIESHPRGRLLDMGCGSGPFLQLAKQEGWEVFGTEFSTPFADAAERRLGIKIHRGQLKEALFPSGYFDVVTLWDVLDLCSDPGEQLREVRRILKPGGLLFIRVPNFLFHQRVAGFTRFIDRWFHPKPSLTLRLTVFHYYGFTPRAIKKFLEKAEFSIATMRNSPPTYGDPYGAFPSRMGRLGFAFLKRIGFLNIQSLYYLSAGQWVWGPSMEIFARKSDG